MDKSRTRYAVGNMGRVVVIRLAPGDDIMESLVAIARECDIKQSVIIGGAASLSTAELRNVRTYPDEFPITDPNRVFSTFDGPLELLSISGNISRLENDDPYIHCHAVISVGKPDALAFGGHLLPGTRVFSTAELSMVEVTGCSMLRRFDDETRVHEVYFE
jgi:uncharacterized protein